jgi:cation transport regulator ChaB
MPKTNAEGDPREAELPSTIQRSPEHAQRVFAESHDAAMEQYGDEERAHRVAYAALKHQFEKVGDHWEAKERKGPSDRQAAEGGVDTDFETAGGVDANASVEHLRQVARRLEIPGRSKMNKAKLVEAIQKANDRASARSRR